MSEAISQDELNGAIRVAARWYARLQSPTVAKSDREDWQTWLQQSPAHQLAWHEVEQVQGAMASVPGDVAAPALRAAALSRRKLLRQLGMFAIAVPVGAIAWRYQPWRTSQAQYVTATGERLEQRLADGGRLILNTATQVDVEYTVAQRMVRLHAGEIFIETAKAPRSVSRPFVVVTPQGRVEALGTRFTVRSDADLSTVTVLDSAVRVALTDAPDTQNVRAGQKLAFKRSGIGRLTEASRFDASWVGGNLVVVDMPLRALLDELSRYRPGLLSCSDDIAALKISGAFPVHDTDRALSAITQSFPVQQLRLTRYWVRITKK